MKMLNLIYSRSKQLLRSFLVLFAIVTMTTALPGCNQNDDNNSTNETGELTIGLTDAPVVSLTLTKANGAVVETVPVATRVDFAQYTEMTEFLTAATVPSGFYVKATLTLDYSNADIRVEDDNGDAVPVRVIQDEQGSAIGEMELSVRLEGLRALLIAPGIPAHLTLD